MAYKKSHRTFNEFWRNRIGERKFKLYQIGCLRWSERHSGFVWDFLNPLTTILFVLNRLLALLWSVLYFIAGCGLSVSESFFHEPFKSATYEDGVLRGILEIPITFIHSINIAFSEAIKLYFDKIISGVDIIDD